MKGSIVLLLCTLAIAFGCYRRLGPSRAHSSTYTVRDAKELQDGTLRLERLKQDLEAQGFKVVGINHSNIRDQFDFNGKYGDLKELKVWISIAKQVETNEPQLGAGLSAFLPTPKAEQDFHDLDVRLTSAVNGK